MALSGSDSPSGASVSRLGVLAGLPDPLQRRLRAHRCTAEHRIRHSGDENDPTWGGLEGVSHLSYARGEG